MTSKVKREIDDLSVEELNFIIETDGKCPECEEGKLKPGPRGGVSQNYRCSNDSCKAGFNLAFAFSFDFKQLIWGHRLAR